MATVDPRNAWESLSEANIRDILEGSRDWIALLDGEGRILWVNRGGCELLEMDDKAALLEVPWFELWQGEEQQAARQAFAAARVGGVGRFQGTLRTTRGRARFMEVHITPVRDARSRAARLIVTGRDLTEARQVEEALRDSEQRLQSMVGQALTGIAEMDLTGRFLRVNSRFCEIVGRPERDLIRVRMQDITHPHDLPSNAPLYERLAHGGPPFVLETRLVRPAGGAVWVKNYVSAIEDVKGTPRGVVAVVVDLTRQKRAEDSRTEMERRFKLMADSAPVMVWMSGTDMQHTWFNKAWLDFRGRMLEQEIGNAWEEGIHADDRVRFFETYENAFHARKAFRVEFRLRGADGQDRWVLDHGVPVYALDGTFQGYIGSCIDITDRKRTEEALAESAERYRLITENSTDLVAVLDREAHFLYATPSWKTVLGRDPGTLIGRAVADFVHPEDLRDATGRVSRLLSDGSGTAVLRFVHARGSWRWLEARGYVIERSDQTQIVVSARDVTEEKEADDKRRELEARLAALLDHSTAAVFIKDRDGRYLLVNRVWERLLQRPEAAIVGRSDDDLFPVEIARRLRESDLAVLRDGRPLEAEESIPTPDGKRTHLTVKFPILDERGLPYAIGGISTDITLRKGAEEALREAKERLESLDKAKVDFINQIAHDLRTPMTPILMQIQLLQRWPLSESQRKSVRILERNMERLNHLVQQLLDVARLDRGRLPLQLERIDLDGLVSETLETFDETARQAGAKLTSQVAADLVVEADRHRVQQVLVNLISNALKFAPGGAITIEARARNRDVLLHVRDDGIGFTDDQGRRLFQPFSQPHDGPPRGGAGLGLYISKGIVEQHGGKMWAESPGADRGASFFFTLPLSGAAPTDHRAPR